VGNSALSSPNFRKYYIGSIFSLLGIWIQRLAIGWQAWELSESAFVVGLVAAVQFLPVIFLTPFFGVIADRIQARSSLIALQGVMLCIAAVLGIVTIAGAMTTEALVGISLFQGVVVSAYTPTRLAMMPLLVPSSQFASAVALMGVVFNLSRFVGPGLAGVVIAVYGVGWAYLINAITYLPVMFALSLVEVGEGHRESKQKGPYLHQLAEGLRYSRDHVAIRQAILIAGTCALLGRGALEIMPALTALIFEGGSNELAILMSSAGIGAIIGSFAFSTRFLQVRMQRLILAGSFMVAIALAVFGMVEHLYAGVAAVMALGFAQTLVSAGSQAFVQVEVENELRGRVMSLWTLFSMGGASVGSLIAGAMARVWNASHMLIAFSVVCLLLALLAGAHKPGRQGDITSA
jgi:MFS family permease